MISLDAEKYKTTGFEQLYLEKVYALLSESMKGNKTIQSTKKPKVVREIVRCLQRYDLLKLMNVTIPSAKDIDDLDEEELFGIMKALILADAEKLKEMYKWLREQTSYLTERKNTSKPEPLQNIFDFLDYFGETAYKSMREIVVSSSDSTYGLEKMPLQMVKSLDIRTCPYCNRSFIGVAEKENLGVQLDHFYSKSIYPFFAVSLYNLIPCCSICNWNKRDLDDEALVSPFKKDAHFEEALRFKFIDDRRIQLDVEKSNLELKSNINAFKLDAAYAFHVTEAKRFTDKMRAYPPSLLQEITRHMTVRDEKTGKKIEKIPYEALEMGLFQEYFCEPTDYIKKPLAKFYRDLYYKYRGWE